MNVGGAVWGGLFVLLWTQPPQARSTAEDSTTPSSIETKRGSKSDPATYEEAMVLGQQAYEDRNYAESAAAYEAAYRLMDTRARIKRGARFVAIYAVQSHIEAYEENGDLIHLEAAQMILGDVVTLLDTTGQKIPTEVFREQGRVTQRIESHSPPTPAPASTPKPPVSEAHPTTPAAIAALLHARSRRDAYEMLSPADKNSGKGATYTLIAVDSYCKAHMLDHDPEHLVTARALLGNFVLHHRANRVEVPRAIHFKRRQVDAVLEHPANSECDFDPKPSCRTHDDCRSSEYCEDEVCKYDASIQPPQEVDDNDDDEHTPGSTALAWGLTGLSISGTILGITISVPFMNHSRLGWTSGTIIGAMSLPLTIMGSVMLARHRRDGRRGHMHSRVRLETLGPTEVRVRF